MRTPASGLLPVYLHVSPIGTVGARLTRTFRQGVTWAEKLK